VTYTVVWADEAFAAAQTYMTDDRDGLVQVCDAVDLLASQPRPAGAYSWGVDRYRIHVGRYRVIYEIIEQTVTVEVIHLGRTG
jgi:mRNA interferase RelE/StbE